MRDKNSGIKSIFNFAVGAAKLANEWRDTIYYGVAGVGAGLIGTAFGSVSAMIYAMTAAVIVREATLRGMAWFASPRIDFRAILAGYKKLPDMNKIGASINLATSYGFCGVPLGYALDNVANGMIPGMEAPLIAIPPVAIAAYTHVTALRRGVTLKDAWNTYRDVLFDYPRKNKDGGGMTQTEKVQNWLEERRVSTIAMPIRIPAGDRRPR